MINSFIKKIRLNNKLSKSLVAKKLDMSRPTYEKVENGEKELTYIELEKLAGIFQIPVDNLINKREFDINVKIEKNKNIEKTENDIRINVPQKNIEKLKEVFLYILIKYQGYLLLYSKLVNSFLNALLYLKDMLRDVKN